MPERVDIPQVNGRDRVGWSDGNNPVDLPRGYYALDGGGQLIPSQRLRLVDDAPGDPADTAHHFEKMPNEAGVGYYHGAHEDEPTTVVSLETEIQGEASFGTRMKQWAIHYILGRKP